MTTELINLWDYRKNLSSLWKKAKKEHIKYIILVNWKPVLEVTPILDNYNLDF